MREFSAVVLTSSVSEFVDTNEIVLISPLSERAFVHSVLMTPAKRSNSFVTCKMHDVPLNIWESLETCWPRLSTNVPLLPPQRLKPLGPGTLMLWQSPFRTVPPVLLRICLAHHEQVSACTSWKGNHRSSRVILFDYLCKVFINNDKEWGNGEFPRSLLIQVCSVTRGCCKSKPDTVFITPKRKMTFICYF